eukprot:1520840-Pyramimonas_sp.AAC.1
MPSIGGVASATVDSAKSRVRGDMGSFWGIPITGPTCFATGDTYLANTNRRETSLIFTSVLVHSNWDIARPCKFSARLVPHPIQAHGLSSQNGSGARHCSWQSSVRVPRAFRTRI